MAARKPEAPRQKEPPSLYCHEGRHWVETFERDPFIVSPEEEAKGRKPRVWRCPAHRGETPGVAAGPTAEPPRALSTAAGPRRAPVSPAVLAARDAKFGPLRAVVEEVRPVSAASRRVRLECGHEQTVQIGAKRWRCVPCLKEAQKGGA